MKRRLLSFEGLYIPAANTPERLKLRESADTRLRAHHDHFAAAVLTAATLGGLDRHVVA
jgi:hypothetical protein